MDISVIGLGYIGLPTAALLASKGHDVTGVDIDESIVEIINSGKIHITEPGIADLVKDSVKSKKLKASTSLSKSDVFLIAVPTPFIEKEGKKTPNIQYILNAVESIAPVIKKGDLVILESTSPIGTTDIINEKLSSLRKDISFPCSKNLQADIAIAYCPERVIPGETIKELQANSRVVGGISNNCSKAAKKFYELFVQGDVIETNAKTAEMAKLAENASRDVQIAFANELSMVAHQAEVNIWELIDLINLHPRVNVLQPGPGVGGHCIAVDPWFLISDYPKTSKLMAKAREINDEKINWVTEEVKKLVHKYREENKHVDKVKVACFGLTYKKDTDDLRESPALKITEELSNDINIEIIAVEPNINVSNLKGLKIYSTEEAFEIAEVSVMLVDHMAFPSTSPTKYYIDTRGIWSSQKNN